MPPTAETRRVAWLAAKYAFFACVAMAGNLLGQELALAVYAGRFSLYTAMAFGTGCGLVIKYLLDKRYIFAYVSSGLADDGKKFILYSLMGVATTLIFWGFEIGFDWAFESKAMRYLGAVLGLTIGYLSKYHLDKRFVFKAK